MANFTLHWQVMFMQVSQGILLRYQDHNTQRRRGRGEEKQRQRLVTFLQQKGTSTSPHQVEGKKVTLVTVVVAVKYVRNGYGGESRRRKTSNSGCGSKGTMMGDREEKMHDGNSIVSRDGAIKFEKLISSKIYANMRRWDDSVKMRQCGVSKTPGCSWIDIGDRVHEFHAGDSLHHYSVNIYQLLNEEMKREGRDPRRPPKLQVDNSPSSAINDRRDHHHQNPRHQIYQNPRPENFATVNSDRA
ncbi:hypothetical protein NC651_007836 [Populus alba x Populus x berolinensis]|nr:hypothetical protein NC651_007836 [Populus alba x Populus x berolinensis]